MISEFIESVGDTFVKVGCKRVLAVMIVGTWAASQLLRIGGILVDVPVDVGVSEEFADLAKFVAGAYFGYSAHKAGVNGNKE